MDIGTLLVALVAILVALGAPWGLRYDSASEGLLARPQLRRGLYGVTAIVMGGGLVVLAAAGAGAMTARDGVAVAVDTAWLWLPLLFASTLPAARRLPGAGARRGKPQSRARSPGS